MAMPYLLTQSWFLVMLAISLISARLSAVHHAEVITHKTGEPFGTLVLSIIVTIIDGIADYRHDTLGS